ncbi:MAG TPA: hypothetical protein VF210_13250 [Pseudomonadales bacterium]
MLTALRLLTRLQRLCNVRLLATLLLLTAIPAAHAEQAVSRHSLTLYHGHGVDEDLLELPGDLVRGSVEWDESYFTALGYRYGTITPRPLARLFDWVHMGDATTGIELVAVKHRGLQSNWEADFAYAIRSPYAALGPVCVRFGFSLGVSYAFGTPSYEDGPVDDPEERYRFQNYNAYELEWGLSRFPRVSLVTRVHHRSGVYGLIAPRRVGSNFISLGLRGYP